MPSCAAPDICYCRRHVAAALRCQLRPAQGCVRRGGHGIAPAAAPRAGRARHVAARWRWRWRWPRAVVRRARPAESRFGRDAGLQASMPSGPGSCRGQCGTMRQGSFSPVPVARLPSCRASGVCLFACLPACLLRQAPCYCRPMPLAVSLPPPASAAPANRAHRACCCRPVRLAVPLSWPLQAVLPSVRCIRHTVRGPPQEQQYGTAGNSGESDRKLDNAPLQRR